MILSTISPSSQSFVILLATTLSGGTPPPDSSTDLISQLTYSSDAPTLAAPWFDADIPRRFRQSMPVPRVPLPSPSEAYAELGRVMDGLRWVCEARDWTVRPSLDARERQASVFALGPEAAEEGWAPLVRSCMSWSIVCPFPRELQSGPDSGLGRWVCLSAPTGGFGSSLYAPVCFRRVEGL